jgi:hypothetical protein
MIIAILAMNGNEFGNGEKTEEPYAGIRHTSTWQVFQGGRA